MYKALFAVSLTAGLLVLNGRGSGAASVPTFSGPAIVAKGRFLNQTAPIPTTTIFTPSRSGLFRLSAYGMVTTADPTSGSQWLFNPGYTDDTGITVNEYAFILSCDNHHVGQFCLDNYGGGTLIFEAQAGTPVTITVMLDGQPDNSAYSLYYTVEHLE